MAHLTELLVSTAEFSNLISFLAVLGGLLVMLVFIMKLIYQDLGDGGGVKVTHRAPQTNMSRVSVPFTLGLGDGGGTGKDCEVRLKLSSQVPYKLRYCWGVDIAAFHHVLRAPWPWFQEAFLHGNLFGNGCVEHGKASPLLQPHEELCLMARRETKESLNLGPAPRNAYPLVVVAVRADLGPEVEDRTVVTAIISVIHIRDSVCHNPSQVLATYLRQGSSIAHLLPLYVTSDPVESSDTESAEEEETEDSEGILGTRARCVVCQLERVTRAALPCRHAITCGSCFEKLKSQCPMCRAYINSYFLLGPEPRPRRESSPIASQSQNRPWDRWRDGWENWNLWINDRLGFVEN